MIEKDRVVPPKMMLVSAVYSEPADSTDARNRMDALQANIMRIDVALNNRNRTDETTGERMHDNEYFAWRQKVIARKARLLETYRAYKRWLQDDYEQRRSGRDSVDDRFVKALESLYRIARARAVVDDWEPGELEVIRTVGRLLERHKTFIDQHNGD